MGKSWGTAQTVNIKSENCLQPNPALTQKPLQNSVCYEKSFAKSFAKTCFGLQTVEKGLPLAVKPYFYRSPIRLTPVTPLPDGTV